jgi:hypothetical protein
MLPRKEEFPIQSITLDTLLKTVRIIRISKMKQAQQNIHITYG